MKKFRQSLETESIPFEQRFVRGAVVSSIRRAFIHFRLPDDYRWAETAVVDSADLPETLPLEKIKIGQELDLFLLDLRKRSGESERRASVTWSSREANPWVSDQPQEGQQRQCKVKNINEHGAFVELDNGITSLIRPEQAPVVFDSDGHPIPRKELDLDELLNIGDQLQVELMEPWKDVLEVNSSVRANIRRLQEEERLKRLEQASQDPIRLLSAQQWNDYRPLEGLVIGLLLDDGYFAQHMASWLRLLGATATVYRDDNNLGNSLHAANRCQTLITSSQVLHLRPPLNSARHEIHHLIDEHNIRLIWLGAEARPMGFAEGVRVELPVNLANLLEAVLPERKEQEQTDQEQTKAPLEFGDYQTQRVVWIAADHLRCWCETHDFQAAMWIVAERSGWYVPRANYGLDDDELERVRGRLGHTLIRDVIESNTQKSDTLPVNLAGPLKEIAPANSDSVICFPIPFDYNGGGEQTISRALVIFYRRQDYPQSPEKILEGHLAEMRLIIEMRSFAEASEVQNALADIGRKGAAYLHEVGQMTQQLHAQLPKNHTVLQQVSRRQWRQFNDDFKSLEDMARGDLKAIQRYQVGSFNLPERIKRLCTRYSFRFNGAQCAFEAHVPNEPLWINLPGHVLDHVLSNLFDNSLYFIGHLARGTGRIRLDVEFDYKNSPERPLKLHVIDNGSGVRSSMVNQLFQPRYSNKGADGTGLGLYLSRGIARSVGGELDFVESIRWCKTHLCLSLPALLDRRK